jgi:hypothetical protein
MLVCVAVCPRGTYLRGGSCTDCEKGFFCPGGNTNARNGAGTAVDFGVRLSCHLAVNDDSLTPSDVAGLGLTTKSTRSTAFTNCCE